MLVLVHRREELLEEQSFGVWRARRTLGDYKRSFRQIVAAVEGIDDAGRTKKKQGSRFDYRSGGRDRWIERIGTTKYFKPKSEDSTGEVEIDDELVEILRSLCEQATGEFVVESDRKPKPSAGYSYTRAELDFGKLYAWLHAKGVKDAKPLHTLRKEFGSIICQKAGLYAASRLLRHADIAVTASYYLDKKERVTVGIAGLMGEP